MNAEKKMPVAIWVIALVGVIWNVVGLVMLVMQTNQTPEQLAAPFGGTPEAIALFESAPGWTEMAWALAVISGIFGGITLLMRRRAATIFFAISAVAVILQFGHSFLVANTIGVLGLGAAALPVLIVLIAVGLLVYTFKAQSRGLLY